MLNAGEKYFTQLGVYLGVSHKAINADKSGGLKN